MRAHDGVGRSLGAAGDAPRRDGRGDARHPVPGLGPDQHVDALALRDDALGAEPVDASDVERGEGGGDAHLLRDDVVEVRPVRRVELSPTLGRAVLVGDKEVRLEGFDDLRGGERGAVL